MHFEMDLFFLLSPFNITRFQLSPALKNNIFFNEKMFIRFTMFLD